MSKLIDLTGKKFGRLTVIKRADDYVSPKGHKAVQWLCECSCDNRTQVIVKGNNLKSNSVQSCGCLAKETSSRIHKKYNTYNLSGSYGIGYDSNGNEFYFDLDDYDKIKNYCWFVDSDGYVKTNVHDKDKHRFIKLHRLICNLSDSNYNVDHIHGRDSRNDNRKSNLRIATKSQNNINACLKRNNTSGVTGVSWYKPKQMWRSYIRFNNEWMHLGYFINFDDAVKARKKAEEKYFGKWSYDNSQAS